MMFGPTWQAAKAQSDEQKKKKKDETTAKNTTTTTTSSGGGSTGGTTNKNSQFTGSSNAIVTKNDTQQAIKNKMNSNSVAWWSADEAGKKSLEAENQSLAAILGGSVSFNPTEGTWSGTAGGYEMTTPDEIMSWNENYNKSNPKKSYKDQYDPQIDALLKEILNRDDFSYNAMNDPLYQQYVQMYRREGDRAMRETMAEAAAGAGGMNTYAITAAQQANNYYNSQLNDKIPELYQLAYEMYLKDKESKVQDLGILQNMDATQYERYRDTINDWYEDKNFAYGAFQDAVAQGNLQTNFDYNAMLDDRNFAYNDMWANKEWDYNDYWKNKEFDYNDEWNNMKWDAAQEDKEYNRTQYDQESAQAEVWKWISLGVKPSADLIKRAGMDEATINMAIEMAKQEQASKATSQGGRSDSKSNGYTGYTGDNGYTGNDDSGDNGANWTKGIFDLGLPGNYSADVIVELDKAGAISEQNGKLVWNSGWNADNFEDRLKRLKMLFPSL